MDYGKERTMHVAMTDLFYTPDQVREEVTPEKVDELAGPIKELGLLQPIGVYIPPGSTPPYKVLFGITRYRAAQQLGMATIFCRIHEHELSPADLIGIELDENDLRTQLPPDVRDKKRHELYLLREAEARALGKRTSQRIVAEELGISQQALSASIARDEERTINGSQAPSQSPGKAAESTNESQELSKQEKLAKLEAIEQEMVEVAARSADNKPRPEQVPEPQTKPMVSRQQAKPGGPLHVHHPGQPANRVATSPLDRPALIYAIIPGYSVDDIPRLNALLKDTGYEMQLVGHQYVNEFKRGLIEL